jgi:2-polyprenyl-6-methoxyphenol hydroxylase-like FAD-dependent oxidoreductase
VNTQCKTDAAIKQHPSATPNERHAVVIGGGMAGLWAGRVLADHFDYITIIDRDRFPDGPSHRKGIPQAYHAHTLLAGGQRALERLFPNLDAELAAAGAPRIDWTWDCRSFFRTGWVKHYRSGLETRTCSRDLLECAIRRALAARRVVRFLEGHEVVGLSFDERANRMTGVRLRGRNRPAGAKALEEELAADLVVDTSGRDSHAPTWLAESGFGVVEETVIDPFLGYASRVYRRPPALAADWRALVVSNVPPHQPRGGVIYPIEGDRWLVTLAGIGRDYPPTDEAGFLAFARSLATPVLHKAIAGAEPLSPIRGYRRTENRWRHYERLPRWPEGFVTLGDAACTYDPVYGQGMTAAARGALALDRCLRLQRRLRPDGDLRGIGRRFQRRLARRNATPWLLATAEDRRWPTTAGGRTDPFTRIAQRYVDLVLAAIVGDAVVGQAFFEVLHLLKPPTILLRPPVLARVLRNTIKPIASD